LIGVIGRGKSLEGSLSSNSEWVLKEMFKRAMHDLHPEIANLDARYDFAEGYKLPPDRHYNLIIDLHRLRRVQGEPARTPSSLNRVRRGWWQAGCREWSVYVVARRGR